jgi:hypothetical protein
MVSGCVIASSPSPPTTLNITNAEKRCAASLLVSSSQPMAAAPMRAVGSVREDGAADATGRC